MFKMKSESDDNPQVFMCFNKHTTDIRSDKLGYKSEHDIKY